MLHDTPLISIIALSFAIAFVLGLFAHRLKLPPLVGYLAAGVIVGPFTPGFVADQKLATELAEIGIILLMFGVGLHFSLKDLVSVKTIALPGALGQIAVATLLGVWLSTFLGWNLGAGILFGLALSVASTVVLLRALQDRRLIETERGKIAVGWLIVEDVVMVVTLVLIPPLSAFLGGVQSETNPHDTYTLFKDLGPVWNTLIVTVIKVTLFLILMLTVGRKVIPSVLHYVAQTGSRELFRLAVFAIAMGAAYGSAKLFGVSFALGAFFAGMILAESSLSTQAAKETLPLRDAFAVLFFVSVGMLFNPASLLNNTLAVIATFLIVVFGKSVAAFLIVRMFGYKNSVALTIAASLAQIGEFSFILVVLGVSLSILPASAQDLIVAGAILSIIANPLMFMLLDLYIKYEDSKQEESGSKLSDHAVVIGNGRVGSIISNALIKRNVPFLVVEENAETLAELSHKGVETYQGYSGEKLLLNRLNLSKANWLFTAIPDAHESGHVIKEARKQNPKIKVIARAHSIEAVEYLKTLGADSVLMGEEEVAKGMLQSMYLYQAEPSKL